MAKPFDATLKGLLEESPPDWPVLVGQPQSFLGRWQRLEYVHGQAVLKTAQVRSGSSVTICPGAISAVRADRRDR